MVWMVWVSASRPLRKLCTWAGNERNDELLPMKPWMYTTRSVRLSRPPPMSCRDETSDWVDDVRGSREAHGGLEGLSRLLLASPRAPGGHREASVASGTSRGEDRGAGGGGGGRCMTSASRGGVGVVGRVIGIYSMISRAKQCIAKVPSRLSEHINAVGSQSS